MSNIKEIILFKIIMQKIMLSRTREDDDNYYFQQKDNKFFGHQFNRNQQFNKLRHFNNSKKMINQEIILMRKRRTSAHMSK